MATGENIKIFVSCSDMIISQGGSKLREGPLGVLTRTSSLQRSVLDPILSLS